MKILLADDDEISRKTIAEYDQLIRRHTMLGEMASQQVAARAVSAMTPAAIAPPPTAPPLRPPIWARCCARRCAKLV